MKTVRILSIDEESEHIIMLIAKGLHIIGYGKLNMAGLSDASVGLHR